MGSWNGTCAISNLPVSACDPVYVFLLTETPRFPDTVGVNRCYSHCWWELFPLHFEGEYDDYGAVENCTGPMLPTIVDNIKARLIEFELGKNEYHDIAVTKEKFNLDLLFEADHEGRLFVKNTYGGANCRAAHIIVHKDIIDGILAEHTVERYKKADLTYAEFLADAVGFYDIIVEKYNTTDRDEFFIWSFSMLYSDKENSFLRWLECKKSECSGLVIQRLLMTLLKDNCDLLNAYIRQLALWMWIDGYMNVKRTVWVPPCGAGSQSDEADAHVLLAKLVQARAKKQNDG